MSTDTPQPMTVHIDTAGFQGSYDIPAKHLAELQAWLVAKMAPKRKRKGKEPSEL